MGDARTSTVTVAGVGSTGPVPVDARSIPEMVLEAVETALEDAKLGYGDIDAVVTASNDLLDGLTASNIAVTEVVGAVMKPETRIAADGLCAAIHGAAQILAGAYETVLVVAHAKPSLSNYDDITLWAMEPVLLQSIGLNFYACAGLQAAALAARDEGAVRRWAETAAARRSAGGKPTSMEDVLSSLTIASPLKGGMAAPLADGAYAVILRRGQATPKDVRLTGVGHDLAPHNLADRDLTKAEGLKRACDRAYARARLDRGALGRVLGIDLVEPCAIFPHEEELMLKAAGVEDAGLVSPDGGLFAGHVPIVAGLSRLAACVKHMRGHDDCKRALAHGAWGPAGQGQAVMILERGAP